MDNSKQALNPPDPPSSVGFTSPDEPQGHLEIGQIVQDFSVSRRCRYDRTMGRMHMNLNLRRCLRKAIFSLLFLVLIILTCGMTYEWTGRIADGRRYPPRGRMVDIGGYRLNINCTGTGSPTVVLDSGLGEPGLSWSGVQSGVERFTRVCSFDRAGYGFSDPGPQTRSSMQIAEELQALLEKAQVPGPYVMVGHSFGGYDVRVFTGLYRDEVSGLVLVDSSHEDQERFEPASVRDEARHLQRMTPLVPLLRFFGVLRLRDRLHPMTISGSKLSPATMREISAMALRPNALPTFLREYALLPTLSAAQVRTAGNLGDLPLIVLTAGQATDEGDEDLDEFRKAWLDQLQPDLVRLSRNGRQVIVEDSDHLIPYKDPEAIVLAIRSVWTAAQHQK
jgi:pimeloyl-ACP methyl ester carboxylesterase